MNRLIANVSGRGRFFASSPAVTNAQTLADEERMKEAEIRSKRLAALFDRVAMSKHTMGLSYFWDGLLRGEKQEYGQEVIKHLYSSAPHIRVLDFTGSYCGPEVGTHLLTTLTSAPLPIHKIHLASSQLGPRPIVSLANFLTTNPKATDISVRYNTIGGSNCWNNLGSALFVNHRLRRLSVSHNLIGTTGVKALAIAVTLNHYALQHLNIGLNPIGAEGFNALGKMLAANPTLDTLVVDAGPDSTCFGNVPALTLAPALLTNTHLRRLNIRQHGINLTGMKALTAALQRNHTLESLNLQGNRFGNGGAEALASCLRVNVGLRDLNIGSCDIQSEGVIAIARSLQENQTLRALSLYYSTPGEEGMETIAQMLTTNTSLQELGLRQTYLPGKGLTALADALLVNKTLLYLDLDTCSSRRDFTDEVLIKFFAAVQKNQGLVALHSPSIYERSEAVIEALVATVENNPNLLEIIAAFGEKWWPRVTAALHRNQEQFAARLEKRLDDIDTNANGQTAAIELLDTYDLLHYVDVRSTNTRLSRSPFAKIREKADLPALYRRWLLSSVKFFLGKSQLSAALQAVTLLRSKSSFHQQACKAIAQYLQQQADVDVKNRQALLLSALRFFMRGCSPVDSANVAATLLGVAKPVMHSNENDDDNETVNNKGLIHRALQLSHAGAIKVPKGTNASVRDIAEQIRNTVISRPAMPTRPAATPTTATLSPLQQRIVAVLENLPQRNLQGPAFWTNYYNATTTLKQELKTPLSAQQLLTKLTTACETLETTPEKLRNNVYMSTSQFCVNSLRQCVKLVESHLQDAPAHNDAPKVDELPDNPRTSSSTTLSS